MTSMPISAAIGSSDGYKVQRRPNFITRSLMRQFIRVCPAAAIISLLYRRSCSPESSETEEKCGIAFLFS